MQRHFDKYGEADLRFSIVRIIKPQRLLSCEQFHLDKHNPYFNAATVAGSRLGVKHSQETCRKISELKKGKQPWLGRKHATESKAKMRAAKLGRKLSAETRAKLSIVRMGNRNTVGNKNRLGKSFTMASRLKISASLKRHFAARQEKTNERNYTRD
jgi:group I intron endonuclease